MAKSSRELGRWFRIVFKNDYGNHFFQILEECKCWWNREAGDYKLKKYMHEDGSNLALKILDEVHKNAKWDEYEE